MRAGPLSSNSTSEVLSPGARSGPTIITVAEATEWLDAVKGCAAYGLVLAPLSALVKTMMGFSMYNTSYLGVGTARFVRYVCNVSLDLTRTRAAGGTWVLVAKVEIRWWPTLFPRPAQRPTSQLS